MYFGMGRPSTFERIMVTAAAADIPPLLLDQLAVEGIMIVPIGTNDHYNTILKVTKKRDGLETEELRDVRFVPLIPEEATGS